MKKKVLASEIKERTNEKKREEKVNISAAILSLFCLTTFESSLTSLSKV
jgi:hypothetical protein